MNAARHFSSALFCTLAALGILQAELLYTRNPNTWVREGPGSYYPLVAVVPANREVELIERGDRWVHVTLEEGLTGWIAASSLADQSGRAPAPLLDTLRTASHASVEGFLAAIRNFARQYAMMFGLAQGGEAGDVVDALITRSNKRLTHDQVAAFGRSIPAEVQSRTGAAWAGPSYAPTAVELRMGLALATRIAERGLVPDSNLQQYLNLVMAHLVDRSPFYDIDFSLFVTNDEAIDAFACPGGFLFLTKGAVQTASDEAELSALVAHEMAHVIHHHGVREVEKRRARLRAADGFDELDRALVDEGLWEDDMYVKVTAELEEEMEIAYEAVVHTRLLEYEMEADRMAVHLLMAAGYDLEGLVSVLGKMARVGRRPPARTSDSVGSQPETAPDRSIADVDAQRRVAAIEQYVLRQTGGRKGGARMAHRFAENTREIR